LWHHLQTQHQNIQHHCSHNKCYYSFIKHRGPRGPGCCHVGM
jgi:hypothetical protein